MPTIPEAPHKGVRPEAHVAPPLPGVPCPRPKSTESVRSEWKNDQILVNSTWHRNRIYVAVELAQPPIRRPLHLVANGLTRR
jgi:hypothetical protein